MGGPAREPSIQRCLDRVGISQLSEWDVLAFIHRHTASLTTAELMARLIGYEITVVGDALDRLERGKLIQRSQARGGVCLYRIQTLNDAGRQRCLQQLVGLSHNRSGRLQLAKILKPVRSVSVEQNNRAQSIR